MNILFWRNTSKSDKRNLCPIYVRITIKGKRSQFSTGIKASSKEWDDSRKRIRGNSDAAILANSKLTAIRDKLDLIYLDRERKNLPVTSRIIKEAFFNPTHAITVNHMFNVLIEEKQEDYQNTVDQLQIGLNNEKQVERNKRNLQKWKRYQSHFLNFLTKTNQNTLLLEELNIDIANQYFRYLKTTAFLSNNTAVRTARPLKTVIQKAIEKEFISVNKLELWTLNDDRKPKNKYVWLRVCLT